jgi:hypothetical protein
MLPCQCDRRALNPAIRPVRPDTHLNFIVVGRRHGYGPGFEATDLKNHIEGRSFENGYGPAVGLEINDYKTLLRLRANGGNDTALLNISFFVLHLRLVIAIISTT